MMTSAVLVRAVDKIEEVGLTLLWWPRRRVLTGWSRPRNVATVVRAETLASKKRFGLFPLWWQRQRRRRRALAGKTPDLEMSRRWRKLGGTCCCCWCCWCCVDNRVATGVYRVWRLMFGGLFACARLGWIVSTLLIVLAYRIAPS